MKPPKISGISFHGPFELNNTSTIDEKHKHIYGNFATSNHTTVEPGSPFDILDSLTQK
jgi:hypothetical protein